MVMVVFMGVLLACLAIGVPVAFSLLLSGIALMAWQGGMDPQVLAMTVINGNDNYALLSIPFFMLAGEAMNAGGLSRRIVDLCIALVGHLHGGLGYVVIIVGVVLAALSGSAVADAAVMAAFLLPMMRRDGYDESRSAGLIATSGLIGPIIPPSLALIFYGILSNTSVSKLFLAGVFPGILMALALAITWAWLMRSETRPTPPRASWAERWRLLRAAAWALGLPVIIIVGLKFGVVTITESAVVSAVYAVLVSTVVYRELKLRELPALMLQAMMTSASVMLIVACAMLSSWMITVSGMGQQMVELVRPFIAEPRMLVGLICLLVLLLGTALEMGPIMLIVTPLVMPLVKDAGVDPVYFGIVFVISGVLGLITPPVGSVLAVVASAGRIEFAKVNRGVTPFLVAQLILLLLLIVFPPLITVPAAWLSQR